MHTRLCMLGVALLVMAGLVCFAATAQPQDQASVSIQNGTFDPATVEVVAGGTVEWTNDDDTDHTVTSTIPLFDSGPLGPAAMFTYTFDEAGTYDYICMLHPEMRGQVVVVESEDGAPVMGNETIPDVIAMESNLTELAAAIEAANLTEALGGEGPFTIFAPNDEAFAAVSADVLNDTALLTQVLTYHVVEGQYMAADLVDGMNLTTLQGGELVIAIGEEGNVTDMNMTEEAGMEENVTDMNLTEEAGMEENVTDMNMTETEEPAMEENVTATVMVNEATVVEADIIASNGVIHIIDAVLVPADLMMPANETMNETANETVVEEVVEDIVEVIPVNTS
ncbi:MAG: fasciclin domain-containing protein [Methanomicrobiaceae archaeon]|nr:fasciclin domain-containing protein [Methanomicrobiaceae archaeon]